MINDFLKETLDKRKDSLKSSSFLESIKNGSIPLSVIFTKVELESRLDDIALCLERILGIARKPHVQSSTEEVIKLSETTSSVSSNQFRKTRQHPALWKQNENGSYPEKVYTSEKTETIDIYENRFILLLLSKIVEEVSVITQEYSSYHPTLISKTSSKCLTFEDNGPFSSFDFLNFPYEFKVSSPNGDDELEKKFLKVQSRISVVKQTDFYCALSKLPPIDFISPTNILIHEISYNYCYKFYIKNFLNKSEDRNTLYYNFVILTLLSVFPFPVEDKRAHLRIDEYNRLRFEPSRIKIGNVILRLYEDVPDLGFVLETRITDEEEKVLDSSSYYLLVTENYNNDNSPLIQEVLKKKREKFTDAFVVTLSNRTSELDHILNIKFSNHKFKSVWENFAKQMTFFINLKGDSYYLNNCPVCGSNLIVHKDNEEICGNCKSHFHLTEVNGTEVLWINAILRKE